MKEVPLNLNSVGYAVNALVQHVDKLEKDIVSVRAENAVTKSRLGLLEDDNKKLRVENGKLVEQIESMVNVLSNHQTVVEAVLAGLEAFVGRIAQDVEAENTPLSSVATAPKQQEAESAFGFYDANSNVFNFGGTCSTTHPNAGKATIYNVVQQNVRSKIIEDAKDEIERLANNHFVDVPVTGIGCTADCSPRYDETTFEVDFQNRTVTCSLRLKHCQTVWAKGVAKCDPEDTFNVSIGKVIALHRALGLRVPDKYIHAPQPSPLDAKVGDTVRFRDGLLMVEGKVVERHANMPVVTVSNGANLKIVARLNNFFKILAD